MKQNDYPTDIIVNKMVANYTKKTKDSAHHIKSIERTLCAKWRVNTYKVNGNDYTSLVSNYTETFLKRGNYSYSWGSQYGSGTWSFKNNDQEIILKGSDAISSRTLFILKSDARSFWYYYMDGNDKYEIHLTQN